MKRGERSWQIWKQQIKRYKNDNQKRAKNTSYKSALKTAIKKFEAAVAANNVEEAKALFVKAAKSLDMAAQKGTVHKNMAARKKSRLAAKLNAMA